MKSLLVSIMLLSCVGIACAQPTLGIKASGGLNRGSYSYNSTKSIGLQYIQPISSSKFSVESGVYIADKVTPANFIPRHFENLLVFDPASQTYLLPGKYKATSHDYYVQVPLLLRLDGKHWYGAAGLTVEYFTHTRNVFRFNQTYIEKPRFTSRGISLNPTINVGYKFKLTDKSTLFLEGNLGARGFNFKSMGLYGGFSAGINFKL